MDISDHLAHLLQASPEDQLELLQRVAALAWREGVNIGLEHSETEDAPINPYAN